MPALQLQFDETKSYSKPALAKMLGVTVRCVNLRVARRQLPKPKKVGKDSFFSGRALRQAFDLEAAR